MTYKEVEEELSSIPLESSGEEIDTQHIKKAGEISHVLDKLVEQDVFQDISKKDMERLQKEIWAFIAASLKGKLTGAVEKYNLNEFDTDYQEGFDTFEFQNYISTLNLSIEHIVKLDGLGVFKDVSQEAYNLSTSEYQAIIQSWARGKIESIKNNIGEVTDMDNEYLDTLKKQNFDFPLGFFSKEFWIVLSLEAGTMIEDIVELVIGLIPSALHLMDYIDLREIRDSGEHLEVAKADIKIAELMYHNPVLAIGEISLEQLEELWKLLKSGTNESVALGITSLVGLIAGGTGIVKVGGKILKKSQKKINIEKKEPHFTSQTSKTEVREAGISKIRVSQEQTFMDVGNYLEYTKGGILKISQDTKIPKEVLKSISNLDMKGKLHFIEALFDMKISPKYRIGIEKIIKTPGAKAYKMVELKAYGFSSAQIRLLMDLETIPYTPKLLAGTAHARDKYTVSPDMAERRELFDRRLEEIEDIPNDEITDALYQEYNDIYFRIYGD